MSYSQAVTLYQPLLFSIAYKLVGSIHDAEDIVQDTFLKWLTQEKQKINNTKAYLIRSVTNSCLNHIGSIKQKKTEYIESLKPGILLEKYKEMDLSHLDLEKELNHALSVIQEKLAPVEKAVFILKEAFNYEYDELKEIVDRKADNCRKLFSRAKQKISEVETDLDLGTMKSNLTKSFRKASNTGEMSELLSDLTEK